MKKILIAAAALVVMSGCEQSPEDASQALYEKHYESCTAAMTPMSEAFGGTAEEVAEECNRVAKEMVAGGFSTMEELIASYR